MSTLSSQSTQNSNSFWRGWLVGVRFFKLPQGRFFLGSWRSWQRVSFATRRPSVRTRLSPQRSVIMNVALWKVKRMKKTDLYSQKRKITVYIRTKAIGGCLGCTSRRRTCQTTKGVGELSRSFDPAVSEWGNPALRKQGDHVQLNERGGKPANWNI